MVRKISFRNTRQPPREGDDGIVDPREERKFQKLVNDDVRADLREISETTPDLRDRLKVTATGEARMKVAHRQDYTPDIISVRVVDPSEEDDVVTVNEYREADSRFVYLKTNAPKGARITLQFAPQ